MSKYSDLIYSEKVMEHVRNPQNVGEMRKPDGVGTVGNPVCGDIMRFFIKVDQKEGVEYLKDVTFQTLGCGAAIATSSMITALAKGKPLSEVEKIDKKVIIEALGGIPPAKVHCSVLADEGLRKAIKDYRLKKTSKP